MSILNDTVSPWSTLISVANPWIDGSPTPVMSHSEAGLPGKQFSATIAFGALVHALAVASTVNDQL